MIARLVRAGFAVAAALIFAGVVLMVQPLLFEGFTMGFFAILAGVVLFIIVDHVPVGTRPAAEPPRSPRRD
ncbi:MAG: hypothetical protein R3F55_02475 [Alphaproteobacteria bacterium]